MLGIGEAYHSPWVVWTWGDGLDAAAARLHRHVRPEARHDKRIIFNAGAPRSLTMTGRRCSPCRVRRGGRCRDFLLDLGWCSRAGLDPYADSAGLTETGSSADLDGLLTRIRSLDLEVGLAIELELVEADPAIVRDHPDWLLTVERDGVTRQVLGPIGAACDGPRVGEADQAPRPAPRVIAELVAPPRCAPAGSHANPAQKHAGGIPASRCAA